MDAGNPEGVCKCLMVVSGRFAIIHKVNFVQKRTRSQIVPIDDDLLDCVSGDGKKLRYIAASAIAHEPGQRRLEEETGFVAMFDTQVRSSRMCQSVLNQSVFFRSTRIPRLNGAAILSPLEAS